MWRRVIRSGLGGKLGPPRLLLRGIDMGGTASVLLWNMGYDPVFTVVELATLVEIPSYVDDGEMLAYGPKQVVAASVMLLVAGHCAGLVAEAHSCRWLATRGTHCRALALAAILPVETQLAPDGALRWHGVVPELLVALLGGVIGPGWAAAHWVEGAPCGCGVKTAIVPAHSLPRWRRPSSGAHSEGRPCRRAGRASASKSPAGLLLGTRVSGSGPSAACALPAKDPGRARSPSCSCGPGLRKT